MIADHERAVFDFGILLLLLLFAAIVAFLIWMDR